MLKKMVSLEKVVNERTFYLYCEDNSPIGEVRTALDSFQQFCDEVEKKGLEDRAREEAAKVQEPPQPPNCC